MVTKEGATFTIMVAGESGLGKLTFINTLFQTTLKAPADNKLRHKQGIHTTVGIEVMRADLEERNFKIRVNVVDTPGFGDNVNNKNAWQPIVDFIDDQHDLMMRQEQQPTRALRKDLRVHVCLYFIRPTGHLLKPLDIEAMKKIGTRCNLVPVIAKADTLLPQEMVDFKARIRQVIEAQQIKIYTPPVEVDDQAAADHARLLIELMPFSVIGAEGEDVEVEAGRFGPGRKYPWGVADVENEDHCDFKKLRLLLLRTNMLDLILATQELHYESYREMRLDAGEQLLRRLRRTHNPKFKEEEEALKKYFTEQVRAEELRFKQWEQNIVHERQRLHKDLEEVQATIKLLEEQVKRLQVKR